MSNGDEKREGGSDPALDGGNYEVIRRRLVEQAQVLGTKAETLNARRKETFGGTELTVIGNERIRTENNCVPRDIVNVGGHLLFGYNVKLGLRTETKVADVFSLHRFVPTGEGFDLSPVADTEAGGFLSDARFVREFDELYKYYKDAQLVQLRRSDTKLLAVFRVGAGFEDVKVFRWALDATGHATYIDNRGERDHVFPASHDFEWTVTGREHHVLGRHPHVNIENVVFVETVGGDLTVKVEDNTNDGLGIYRELVDDAHQSLDDAEIHYARLGLLVLLKIRPYRETVWRYLVFNTRTRDVKRIDAIGRACVQLPEDHGIIFPGGYYLQTGETKVFTEDTEGLLFKRSIRSPNGEDVLYVFYRQREGESILLPYNLIRKAVQSPVACNGWSLFDDGKMTVFRAAGEEPTRIHPMQIWQTPFTSREFAAAAPTDGSFLSKVGNAELVRGISDCLSIQRLVENTEPSRATFEDLIRGASRLVDNYYWLSHAEVGDLAGTLQEIRQTAELVVDEFEKVQQLQARARQELEATRGKHTELIRSIHPDDWREVADFLRVMTALRHHRGHLITLRELRYVDLERIDALETETAEQFERVTRAAVAFLLRDDALRPLTDGLEALLGRIEAVDRVVDVKPLEEELETTGEGLTVLSEVIGDLQVDDPSARTRMVEGISSVFAHVNRVRATLANKKKALMRQEGHADFGAQFALFGQNVSSALALADDPEKCDEQLSRIMVQLEELESRFSEFDEFMADLASKREEVYEGFSSKKQTLLDERNRRAQNLIAAADRIIAGVKRRASGFKSTDELNAYFASDAMVLKLRGLAEQLDALGDSVKAEELRSKIKQAKQDGMRGLRDRTELFEDGEGIIKFGRHRFAVNTQPLELTIVPRGEGMAFHLTGTDFYESIDDETFAATRPLWEQTLVSETPEVYRGEYLAATILFAAEARRDGLSIDALQAAALSSGGLLGLVRRITADRYDEGYERGIHDADATAILDRLLSLRQSAGLLRFAPTPRALGALWWAFESDAALRRTLQLRAKSLGRLRLAFRQSPAEAALARDLEARVRAFCRDRGIEAHDADLRVAGLYLVEELVSEPPRLVAGGDAIDLRDAFLGHLTLEGRRSELDADLAGLEAEVGEAYRLALAWIEAFLAQPGEGPDLSHAAAEAAVLLITERRLDRVPSSAVTRGEVGGLLGAHPRIRDGKLELRLDEFLSRLGDFVGVRVPAYRAYRKLRVDLVERQKARLRLEEFKPRVLSTFVRNKLINDVYLPLIGENLAKQLGSVGESKRTDLMGMLLLISPPGYGKTTLMEYLASSLGMVFMKVNGPSLGHSVTSIDPNEAPNATSRQEVEKINLALEMGNNVMLYLDDIQHTNPELLQKFISLCDAQRRIEGVWRGRTRTYDLRGKKFCVVMAGNPYTESGDKFVIPDMLANRADTYNLGDVLEGKDEAFSLSYVENALTSNPVTAPLSVRDQSDVYKLIRMARGAEVQGSELSHGYSAAELHELVSVLKKFLRCQEVLLKVNLQYIESAAQADEYRTEPTFKLQGSYRNMNKLAEKIVSAMNDGELESLIDDHYAGEAQTLTTGAEHNLLKLAELRGRMSPAQVERWTAIKKDFGRIQLMGGKEDDPVARVTGTLGGLGQQLDGIREGLLRASAEAERRASSEQAQLLPQLERLEAALGALRVLGRPQLEVKVDNQAPPGLEALLAGQARAIEDTLVPMVLDTARNAEIARALGPKLGELLELLRLRLLGGGLGLEAPAAPLRAPAPPAVPTPAPARAQVPTPAPRPPAAPAPAAPRAAPSPPPAPSSTRPEAPADPRGPRRPPDGEG